MTANSVKANSVKTGTKNWSPMTAQTGPSQKSGSYPSFRSGTQAGASGGPMTATAVSTRRRSRSGSDRSQCYSIDVAPGPPIRRKKDSSCCCLLSVLIGSLVILSAILVMWGCGVFDSDEKSEKEDRSDDSTSAASAASNDAGSSEQSTPSKPDKRVETGKPRELKQGDIMFDEMPHSRIFVINKRYSGTAWKGVGLMECFGFKQDNLGVRMEEQYHITERKSLITEQEYLKRTTNKAALLALQKWKQTLVAQKGRKEFRWVPKDASKPWTRIEGELPKVRD